MKNKVTVVWRWDQMTNHWHLIAGFLLLSQFAVFLLLHFSSIIFSVKGGYSCTTGDMWSFQQSWNQRKYIDHRKFTENYNLCFGCKCICKTSMMLLNMFEIFSFIVIPWRINNLWGKMWMNVFAGKTLIIFVDRKISLFHHFFMSTFHI